MALTQYNLPISDTMLFCAAAILQQNTIGTPEVFGTKLTKFPRSGHYTLSVLFHGTRATDGSPFQMVPLEINKMTIAQKFTDNYMDDISLVLSLAPEQALTFIDNYRNLRATVMVRYANVQNEWIDTEEPCLQQEYVVILKDKDLRKRINKQVIIPESGMEMTKDHADMLFTSIEVQLIEEAAYGLRKRQFNIQLRNTTVMQAVMWIAQSCGIKRVHMPPPDNTKVYDNFIIPPMHTFETAMQHIQNYYGIYAEGLGFYYTGGVLYVYRAYSVTPPTASHVHLYYVGNGKYLGCPCYHAYAGDTAHIVINRQVNIKDLVDSGVENIGNDYTIQDAATIVDKYRTVYPTGDVGSTTAGFCKVNLLGTTTTRRTLTEDRAKADGIMDSTYSPKFFFDESNPFKVLSYLHSYRRALYGTQWESAVPYTFKPGHMVSYHYDGEDIKRREQGVLVGHSLETMIKTGICEDVEYIFTQGAKRGNTCYYTCLANLRLSMASENVTAEPTKSLDSTGVDTTSAAGLSKRPGAGGGIGGATARGGTGSYVTTSGVALDNEYDGLREDILQGLKAGKRGCPRILYQHYPECNGRPELILEKYGNSGLPATNKAKQQTQTNQTVAQQVSLF